MFATFLQNHDQIANSGRGLRAHLLTSPGRYKALTAVLLLGPGTPMLFQGQEFAASSPFFYFADFAAELDRLTQQGRAAFLSPFPSLAQPVVNLGRDLHLNPAPEPLLAPPQGMTWQLLWSSEDPRYGGSGTPPLEDAENWHILGHAAMVLKPAAGEEQ